MKGINRLWFVIACAYLPFSLVYTTYKYHSIHLENRSKIIKLIQDANQNYEAKLDKLNSDYRNALTALHELSNNLSKLKKDLQHKQDSVKLAQTWNQDKDQFKDMLEISILNRDRVLFNYNSMLKEQKTKEFDRILLEKEIKNLMNSDRYKNTDEQLFFYLENYRWNIRSLLGITIFTFLPIAISWILLSTLYLIFLFFQYSLGKSVLVIKWILNGFLKTK